MGDDGWYTPTEVCGVADRLIESLREYFERFGEITECTVMRESQSGRSRGFGFLTFKDPKVVNRVMTQEHILDGKIVCQLYFYTKFTPD